MTKENKGFKVLSGFQGFDFVIKIDGNVVGAITNFEFDTSSKTIDISSIIFGCEQSEIKVYKEETEFKKVQNSIIEQYLSNEYGFKAYRKFSGVNYMNQKGSLNMDSYNEKEIDFYKETYTFKYDSASPLYLIPLETSFEDISELIEKQEQ